MILFSLDLMPLHIRNADLAIYAVHGCYWAAMIVGRLAGRKWKRSGDSGIVAREVKTAKYSRVLVGVHFVAFAFLYSGIASAVFQGQTPIWFPGQRIVGGVIIGVGAALAASAMLYFQSWRFRAEVSSGHRLATGGPFSVLRHPVYMGLNLLALGSAFWIPTGVVWIGFVLMLIGSDLRGRAEEKLLLESFGDNYLDYKARTSRCVPGIY
jgi:protein-S-isoprenylcysteine O-methyltransferase Ste14